MGRFCLAAARPPTERVLPSTLRTEELNGSLRSSAVNYEAELAEVRPFHHLPASVVSPVWFARGNAWRCRTRLRRARRRSPPECTSGIFRVGQARPAGGLSLRRDGCRPTLARRRPSIQLRHLRSLREQGAHRSQIG